MVDQRTQRRTSWARPGPERPAGPSWDVPGAARERASGGRVPWRGIAVLVVGLAVGAGGFLVARGVTPSGHPAGDAQAPADVVAGQCLASLPAAAGDDLDVVPCERQHLGEVLGSADLGGTDPAGSWPGQDAVAGRARTACAAVFEAWVGRPPGSDALGLVAVPPTQAAWRTGDRSAVCLAEGAALVGSVRDSGR